jgi:tRNA(Ser,Leu) C12 N-acetylase TAN1
MNVHINILKRLDNIINDTAEHIHDYIEDPHTFTRRRKLDAQAYTSKHHCKYFYTINFKTACLIVQKKI